MSITTTKGVYIGDICYVLDDDVYDGVWGQAGYEDGLYEDVLGVKNGSFEVYRTYWGDGGYDGSDGHTYDVDAGVIGIVSAELLDAHKREDDSIEGGRFITFDDDEEHIIDIDVDEGTFTITVDSYSFEIYTGPSDEDEDGEYDEYDDEEEDW